MKCQCYEHMNIYKLFRFTVGAAINTLQLQKFQSHLNHTF